MRMPSLRSLALAALTAVPAIGLGAAPHDGSFTDGQCSHCHSLYSPGGGATDYTPGCLSCHATRTNGAFGFPWISGDQASPGKGGVHHSWSGFAANAAAGASLPTSYDLQRRLVEGRLQCATCHDVHEARPENAPNSKTTSIAIGAAVDETGGPGTGTGKMTLVSAGKNAGFRVKIQTVTTGGAGGGTFILSHEGAVATPRWLNWSGSAWVAGTAAGAGRSFTNGTAVALDDPAVTVRFTAGFVVGDYWDFYVAYPGVRAPITGDAFCLNCHRALEMTHVRASGTDPLYPVDGKRLFSHPVGQALGANGKDTDRPEVLDATGVTQTTGDGNPTNDLKLDGGVVRCTTCHAVHNTDSNSITVDVR